MKTELEIIEALFGNRTEPFAKQDMVDAMRGFANQFRWVKTTCGKNIEFDDLDYEVLRQQALFIDTNRNVVMALWFTEEGKRTVAPVAKLMLDAEGKSIIHYKDKNPLNLKRENIEFVEHKIAHQKRRKNNTANGKLPTSVYKGVSWSRFAKKWCAYIKVDFKKKHLGYFTEEEDAGRAYNESAIEHWGKEYSNLNIFPSDNKIQTNPKK